MLRPASVLVLKGLPIAGAEHQKKIGQQAQDFQKTFRDEVSLPRPRHSFDLLTCWLCMVESPECMLSHGCRLHLSPWARDMYAYDCCESVTGQRSP